GSFSHPGGSILGGQDFRMGNALLAGVVEGLAQALVVHLLGGTIGDSGNNGAPAAAADDLRVHVVNCHPPFVRRSLSFAHVAQRTYQCALRHLGCLVAFSVLLLRLQLRSSAAVRYACLPWHELITNSS